MKKLISIVMIVFCSMMTLFAKGMDIGAGVSLNSNDEYDDLAIGGAVEFDYSVADTNVILFSNTDFAFASGNPNYIISEIIGVGYRFNFGERFYLQSGAGLGFMVLSHEQEDGYHLGEYSDEIVDKTYYELGIAVSAKFGVKFTEMLGMNVGLDVISRFKEWASENTETDIHYAIIPKVCFVVSF